MNTTLTFTKFDKVKTKLPGGQMAFFVMIMFGFRISLEEELKAREYNFCGNMIHIVREINATWWQQRW